MYDPLHYQYSGKRLLLRSLRLATIAMASLRAAALASRAERMGAPMRTKPLLGQKAWFGPHRVGWGLSPVSYEGWVTTAVAVGVVVALAVAGHRHRWIALPVVILLLVIVLLKGTSPGGPRAWEEFQASKDRDGQ
jgi:hypothetical protein